MSANALAPCGFHPHCADLSHEKTTAERGSSAKPETGLESATPVYKASPVVAWNVVESEIWLETAGMYSLPALAVSWSSVEHVCTLFALCAT